MVGIRATITRYVSDEPQPGIVECEFVDASRQVHRFIEKTLIVSDFIDSNSSYPRPCFLACEIIEKHPQGIDEVVIVDTERPWGIQSTDGLSRFKVLATQLEEFKNLGEAAL